MLERHLLSHVLEQSFELVGFLYLYDVEMLMSFCLESWIQ